MTRRAAYLAGPFHITGVLNTRGVHLLDHRPMPKPQDQHRDRYIICVGVFTCTARGHMAEEYATRPGAARDMGG
jgi:hypothetical protein